MARARVLRPERAASPALDRGAPLAPRQAPLPAHILELQATAGNCAVAAMLARMPATAVSDIPNARTVPMYADATGYGSLDVGTLVEVTEPLTRSPPTDYVHTTADGEEYWISIGDLRPSAASGELPDAVRDHLKNQLVAESTQTLTNLLMAAKALAQGNVGAAKASEHVAAAAKAIDDFKVMRGVAESRAARRGLTFVAPDFITNAQAAARMLMGARHGAVNTMSAVEQEGATREGLALYRDLRNLLELPEFSGLAAEATTAGRFGAFEETVAGAVANDPLTDEPDVFLAGDRMLAHDVPAIGPGTAFESRGGETTDAAKAQAAPQGEPIGAPVIGPQDPWPGVQAPRTVEHVRDDREGLRSLYIDGRPSADDVMQTGLSDCYYLSLVTSVADRDANRILALLPDTSSDTFRVTFHFQASKHSTQAIPRTVELPLTLAYDGENLLGARFRIVPTGVSRWTRYEGGVHEQRLYKAALWAPLMEKAYARFAQEHGMYGELFGQDEATSGYDVIGDRGGSSHWLASVIYGNDLRSRSTHGTMLAPGEAGAEPPSADLVATLAKLAAHGVPEETVHLTAGTDDQSQGQQAMKLAAAIVASELGGTLPGPVADRLTALATLPLDENGRIDAEAARDIANDLTDALVYLDDVPLAAQRDNVRRQLVVLSQLTCPSDLEEATAALPAVREALRPGARAFEAEDAMDRTGVSGGLLFDLKRAQNEFLAETADDEYTVQLLRKLINLSKDIPPSMAPGDDTLSALRRLRADPRGSHLLDLAASMRNKADSSPAQRFVYKDHAYAVLAADFRDAMGRPVAVVPAGAAEAIPRLDTTKSLVTVRNPHHENQPDPGATKSRGTGEFTLTLAQFARQFSSVREAIVKKTA